MALTKFNINDYICFEENENTRSCVTRFYRELYGTPDVEDKVNWFMNYHTTLVDGKPILRMQFHEFASTIGRYMIMGSSPYIKENNLYFETKDDDSKARLLAEFENFRRRTEKERSDLVSTANKKLLGQLTEVYDDFDRAFAKPIWGNNTVSLLDGLKKIYVKFKKIMTDNGLEQFDPTGESFDPQKHEAFMQKPSFEYPENTVSTTLQPGYTVNGNIIKHAQVVVSSGCPGGRDA